MTLTDYKYSNILHFTNESTEALVRFYEGEITTEFQEDPDGLLVSVTRYRRTRKLREVTFKASGRVSDENIHAAMNVELAKDTTRDPIDEQKVVASGDIL